jgi:hypothetical protein
VFEAGARTGAAPSDFSDRLQTKVWWRVARVLEKFRGAVELKPRPQLQAPTLPVAAYQQINGAMRNLYYAAVAAVATAGVSVLTLVWTLSFAR